MNGSTPSKRLTLVAASAGSGKTHRLTQEVLAALDPQAGAPLSVDQLLAVTFTRKAAAELASRVRAALVRQGAFVEASRLPLALIGTVHATCLRLLRELAFDAGRSPHLEPLGDEAELLLRQSLDEALPLELVERLQTLADRWHVAYDDRRHRSGWVGVVRELMNLARANRLRPEALDAMANRSAEGFLALFPPPSGKAERLDAELGKALRAAEAALDALNSPIKLTLDGLAEVREARRLFDLGPLPWARWAKLSELDAGATGRTAVAPLHAAAGAFVHHPRFHAELHELLHGLFQAARMGLSAYADWKARHLVVDYTDMVDATLELLELPTAREELASRLELLVVDEFQDTDPLQLALFTRLHALIGRSVWVGDRKQCIFSFTGADPALMEAVTEWAARTHQAHEVLPFNYRSRPELVELTSELFARAFAPHGMPPEEVRTQASRETPAALAALPPLGLCSVDGKKNETVAAGLARLVRRLLDDPETTPVLDPRSGIVRPCRAGDLAVLVRRNQEADDLAQALSQLGVPAAIARRGLLDTPEGTLLRAAITRTLDRRNRLAEAELEALSGWIGAEPEAWLAARLEAAKVAMKGESPEESPTASGTAPASCPCAWVQAVDALRPQLVELSPSELVDRLLEALDAGEACARWPEPVQRVANLDALRGLARAYEELCRRRREPATPSGLLRFFDEVSEEDRPGGERLDAQHFRTGDEVVTISTYHRAKGLEWPVVVLSSLDAAPKDKTFGLSAESDRATFDPEDPLGGRWIRYWPQPIAGEAHKALAARAGTTAVGQRAVRLETQERLRLLYVGFTRARDHLVLALRERKLKQGRRRYATWLEELRDAKGAPLLELPEPGAAGAATVTLPSGTTIPARAWDLVADPAKDARTPAPSSPPRRFAGRPGPGARPSYRISPSKAREDWPSLPTATVLAAHDLGARLGFAPREDEEWTELGTLVHALFAADPGPRAVEERRRRATRLIDAAGFSGRLDLAELFAQADALARYLEARWPGARSRRELPVVALLSHPAGTRRLQGTIDLLLETPSGAVVLDHKCYPDKGEAGCRARSDELSPQLVAYATALRRLGREVPTGLLHFPLSGYCLELELPQVGP